MTVEEEFEHFIANESKMSEYHKAISVLREIGFEKLMRRLGEPTPVDMSNPKFLEICSGLQMLSNGYYDALETFFDVRSIDKAGIKQDRQPPDFGADDMMDSLGYEK